MCKSRNLKKQLEILDIDGEIILKLVLKIRSENVYFIRMCYGDGPVVGTWSCALRQEALGFNRTDENI
jgi:hypothetical protein